MVESNKTIITEIVILSVISLITIFLFSDIKNKTLNETYSLLSYNTFLELRSNNDNEVRIIPSNDNTINDLDSPSYQVLNNKENSNYSVILIIDKASTYDLDYFNYKINNKIAKLNSAPRKEDDTNYYYYLDNINNKEFTFNLWLNDNYHDDFTKYKLIYQISIQEEI